MQRLRRSAVCFLGIHAAVAAFILFPSGTYRQLFQVDVTFAFVSAYYQVTLSIVMAKEEEDRKGVCLSIAIQLQSTTVSLKLYSRSSIQPQNKRQNNESCKLTRRVNLG